MVDAEPSGFISNYLTKNNNIEIKFVKIDNKSNDLDLKYLEEEYDDIFIDSGAGELLEKILPKADNFIVPVLGKDPQIWSMWNLAKMETLLKRVWKENTELKAYSTFYPDQSGNSGDAMIQKLINHPHFKYLDSDHLKESLSDVCLAE